MDLIQWLILILSTTSIWLVARTEKWSRWGFIVGLIAQPFWLYSSIKNDQWGIVILTLFYTYSWSMGIYNYFVKK